MKNKKDNLVNIIKNSALYLLLLLTNILLITTLLYFCNFTINKMYLPIIYIISTIIYFSIDRKENVKNKINSFILATFIFILSIFIIGNVYDLTADGNTYHKLAVGAMKNGWNPFYESIEDFNKSQGNVFDVSEENINSLWADHYAKATETFGAVIYAFTGNIETGKVYNILFMYICFGIILSYLYKNLKIDLLKSFIVSMLIAFNGITIVQIFNYYVDGTLMMNLFLLIFTCFLIRKKIYRKNREYRY